MHSLTVFFPEFLDWKSGVEDSERTSFVKICGTSAKNGVKKYYYQCNRAGQYRCTLKSKERKRQMKSQGKSFLFPIDI